MAQTLFISDLHLDPRRPGGLAAFRVLLNDLRRGDCAALYILGDLFEAWIGDDDDLATFVAVQDWIAEVVRGGVPVYVMHGNRDFLIGQDFCRRSGATLLVDPSVVELGGEPVLLSHGDALCTDDHTYQAMRAQFRDPAWQADFLAQPLTVRRQLASALREESEKQTTGKDAGIMDVNPAAVAEMMTAHGVARLIHGHTHRPAVHDFDLHGQPAQRIVLGDWYHQGSCLRLDAQGYHLESFDLPAT